MACGAVTFGTSRPGRTGSLGLAARPSLPCRSAEDTGQRAAGEASTQRPPETEQGALSGFPVPAPSPPETQLHLPCLGSSNVPYPYNKCSLFKSFSRSFSDLSGSLILAIKRALTKATLCSSLDDLSPGVDLQPIPRAQHRLLRPERRKTSPLICCFLAGYLLLSVSRAGGVR